MSYDRYTYDYTKKANRTEGATGTPAQTRVAVATANTTVLAANSGRLGVILSNAGANDIYINLQGNAPSNADIRLPAGSPPLVITSLCPTGIITGIALTATTNLSVVELT